MYYCQYFPYQIHSLHRPCHLNLNNISQIDFNVPKINSVNFVDFINKVPCSKIVDNEVLIDYRSSCLEMDKSELDLLIKVKLFDHRNNSTLRCKKKNTHTKTKRENNATIFFQWSPVM